MTLRFTPLLFIVGALACSPADSGTKTAPNDASKSQGTEAPAGPTFDGDRAFADLVDLVRIGPRDAGSSGSARAQEFIASRLRQAGWRATEQPFKAAAPGKAPIDMTNVVGSRDGRHKRQIWLMTHYDTKNIPGIEFVGANDGASGVAVLLEFARQIATRELEYGVTLVFFDGEEAMGRSINAVDGLFGSRWLAAKMEEEGTLDSIAALILVDMVGDRDLNLAVDISSSPQLRQTLARTARRLGMDGVIDSRQRIDLIDDHTPFVKRGVSNALALIDFQFGSRNSPGPHWHTDRDNLSAVSAESLNTVGTLLVETFGEVENDLRGANGP